jgi:hypothetical protein
MILRLRQLCCHPNLILSLTDGYADPTLLVGSENDKELGRAKKIMGAEWVTKVGVLHSIHSLPASLPPCQGQAMVGTMKSSVDWLY